MDQATWALPGALAAGGLAIEQMRVRLRLSRPVELRFLHGGALRGLLSRACGAAGADGLFPLALESGHVRYAAGELYDFVVVAVGEGRALGPGLAPALRLIGRERRWGVGLATFEGNFEVVSCERLARPSAAAAAARAARLASAGPLRMIFHAPLRLRRPAGLGRSGSAHLDQECFPARYFLEQLGLRRRQLAGGEAPLPPLPAAVNARVEPLSWLDLPLGGQTEGPRGSFGRGRLGGVCGSVVFEQLPPEWVRLLVEMEHLPWGDGAAFGLGAFALESLPAWLRPARSFAERLGADARSPAAAAAMLAPAALALLDDGAAYQRRGLSRFSAEGGLRRARELGLNGPVGGAGTRFVAALAGAEVMARLRALWPGEPLLERVPGWLAAPAQRAELERLLVKVFAAELADELAASDRCLVRCGGELRVLGREAARVA